MEKVTKNEGIVTRGSWWQTADRRRLMVVLGFWYKDAAAQPISVEISELGKTNSQVVGYELFVTQIKNGNLKECHQPMRLVEIET